MHTLNNLVLSISHLYRNVARKISLLESVALLAARFYVGWAFFSSGLTKLRDWDSTLTLFEYEYQVPILPFELAAYLGTAAEIILPLLLIAGLASRVCGGGLFFL
jgi:putative oxidoreductase